jgi:hypothetical protein
MNTYRLYVAPYGSGENEKWEVSGENVFDAFNRLQTVKPNLGRLIGYKVLQKGDNDEKNETNQ